MKKQLLKEIIEKKEKKIEFAIITNLTNGESCIFEKDKPLDKNFEKHKENITEKTVNKFCFIIGISNLYIFAKKPRFKEFDIS